MYIFYVISFIFIILLSIRSSKDYLSPINFILIDTSFRALLPIAVGGLYFSVDIVDIRITVSLIIHMLSLFLSFYLFMYIGSNIKVAQIVGGFEQPNIPKWVIWLFIFAAIFSFLCIFIFGKWSLIAWLESPRTGYQFGRKGVGMFFVLFVLFIYLSWISFMTNSDKFSKLSKIIIAISILYLAYLTGSKRVVVTCFLFYFLYRNMYIAKLNFIQVVWTGFFLMLAFLFYFLLLSGGIGDIIGYFNYFQTTQDIYGRLEYGLLDFQGGAINSSRIWEFIPRFIYEDKPYVYGGGMVTEIISPGKVAEGHNLGMLDFTVYYLDFGQLGVFMHAFFAGSYAGFVYGVFKNKKNSFFFLLLYFSLFSNVLTSSPNILYLIVLSVFYFAYLFYKQFIRIYTKA